MLTPFPVSGPTRYDYIIYQDKVIHNIGDVHRYYDSCEDEKTITVEELLDATIAHHADEIIDIFFECGPQDVIKTEEEDVPPIDSYISQLHHHFNLCFVNKDGKTGFYRTRACDEKYPNVRFHLIDFRQFIIQFLKKKTHIPFDEYIMNMYYYGTDSVNLHVYIRTMFNNQYRAIEDESIIEKLELMYKDMIHKIQSIPFEQFYDNFSSKTTFILMTLMDIYLLARMFRRYDSDSPSFKNATPNKIIIYSGMYHTHNYNEFLKQIGGEVVMHSGSYEFPRIDTLVDRAGPMVTQCISIPVIQGTHSLSFTTEEPILLQEQLSKSEPLRKQTMPNVANKYILPLSIPILKHKSPKQIDLPYSYFKRFIGTIFTLIDMFRKQGITITEQDINVEYQIPLHQLKSDLDSILQEIQTHESMFDFNSFTKLLNVMKNKLKKISKMELKDFNELWDSVYTNTELVNTSFDTLSLGIKSKRKSKKRKMNKKNHQIHYC
jgi:hypothetical protein